VDFIAANQWEPSYFFRNECSQPGAFLGLHLLLPCGPPDDGALVTVQPGHPGPDLSARPAIGATAVVRQSGGRIQTAVVDGGNGHSGRQSSDLHFGLGPLPDNEFVAVDLTWRDPHGKRHEQRVSVATGWQTVILGSVSENAP
jgi:hypothetical protein